MILPTKRITASRALLGVGANVLRLLDEPKTVSRLWEEVKVLQADPSGNVALTFDWLILSLDLLFAMDAIEMDRGRVQRQRR